MSIYNRALNGFFWTGTAVIFAGLVAYFGGLRVNTTKSIPLGFYVVTDAPITKDAYVIFCPPDNAVFQEARSREYITAGFCEGDYGYMMKKVVGVAGDEVVVADEGVRINGTRLPLSAVIDADGADRPLPRTTESHYTLAPQSLLLMSDVSAISFDGRYFGAIDVQQIRDVITPVYTWH